MQNTQTLWSYSFCAKSQLSGCVLVCCISFLVQESNLTSDFVYTSVHILETNVVLGIEDLQQRTVFNFHHLNYQLPQIWPVNSSELFLLHSYATNLLFVAHKLLLIKSYLSFQVFNSYGVYAQR